MRCERCRSWYEPPAPGARVRITAGDGVKYSTSRPRTNNSIRSSCRLPARTLPCRSPQCHSKAGGAAGGKLTVQALLKCEMPNARLSGTAASMHDTANIQGGIEQPKNPSVLLRTTTAMRWRPPGLPRLVTSQLAVPTRNVARGEDRTVEDNNEAVRCSSVNTQPLKQVLRLQQAPARCTRL